MKRDERKLKKLIGYQIDTGIAQKLVSLGYSVSKLRNTSISELQDYFDKEKAQEIKKSITRQPIPEDVLFRLMDECDWTCCVCWDVSSIGSTTLNRGVHILNRMIGQSTKNILVSSPFLASTEVFR